MKQKIANQSIKKNFILYKGHTGWKIKTRLFGTLLVGLSAMTIAESVGTVNAHAATEASPSEDASPAPAPKTTGTATLKGSNTDETPSSQESSSQESGSQAPASQESGSQASGSQVPASSQESGSQAPASQEPVSQAPTNKESGSQAPANKKSGSQASASEELTIQAPASRRLATRALAANLSIAPASMRIAPESFSLDSVATDTTNDAATYQTLTPGQTVEVGKTDGSGVTLSGSQVLDHFTNTVQNYSSATITPEVTAANTVTSPADANGVWQLTTNGKHPYIDPDHPQYPTTATGPQVAHVSFENDIDFEHNFTMTGALGIGTKALGGADGVGIVFAPGDPKHATEGKKGGNLGLGGLDNAFAFVYDDHHNDGTDDTKVVDPGSGAYFGWRSTDANGAIQNVTNSNDWKAANALSLNDRVVNPLNNFTMTYDAGTKLLSITIGGQEFTRTISDTSTGYSISIAASTGQDKNDYSAKIDSFTYTPKTASVNVTVADTTVGDTQVSTTTPVTANIGDTIYVFSTKAAAERAVAADSNLDPKLVTVIPASTTNNVYVIDGDKAATGNGAVHYINDDSSIADGAYYSYTVTGDASQALTVPISQAFTANVTPVDSVTGDPIPGMDPIQVNSVAGKSVVIQVPGYTPVTVKLDAPAAGETVVNEKVKINTGTTPSTATDVANPIEHYYTAAGETIDGTPVTANVTVGTNQSVTDALNATPIGEDGKPVTDGSTPAYTWSTVSNASATDSTDSTAPQDSKSILVPTKVTLDKWLQKAKDNQAKADDYQKKTQAVYDKFVGLTGITQEQKAAAQQLLDSVNDMYAQLSTDNATAKDALQAAEDATDPETIFEKGQAGYGALANMDDTMTTFQNDLDNLTATNDATVASLATFISWSRDYGQTLGFPDVTVGDGFGATLTQAQKDGFNNPDYYYYVNATDSDTHVTPKDAGTYYFKLTDDGRTYLKSLTTNTNAGLYTSAALTINPVDVTPTLTDSSLQYGGVAGILPLANINYHLGTVAGDDDPALKITQDDFEIDDANNNKVEINQLQVGGKYTIRYTNDAQATLKADKNYNFTFDKTSTATLTVTPREVLIVAANVKKTYGDTDPAALSLDNDSAKAALVNGDDVSSLGANLTRETGENAGSYKISGTATANKNYAVTVRDGKFTIAQKAITVKANNVSVDYDGTAHQVDQLGFTIPDGALVGTDTAADLDVTLTPSAETNAGTYTISGTSTAANYAVTVEDGTLTIAQKAATVTANAATVGYGDALPTLTVTNSDTGLKTTLDNTDFEIFDNKAKAVATGQLQAGGDYTIRLTQAAQDSLNTANPNYKLSFGTDVLTVNKKPITVQINNVDATYDGAAHGANGFSISKDDKLVDGDSDDALGVTLDPISETDAGTYTITGKTDSANYDVTVNDGTLTIAQKAATITADAATVGYGNALPTLTVTNSDTGLKTTLDNTDFEIFDNKANAVATGQLQAGGDYTIRLTQAAQGSLTKDNPNYKLSFGENKLTVTQRAITVHIEDGGKDYGVTTDPALTFTIPATTAAGQTNGTLVDPDTQDALGVTLTRENGNDAGSYNITGTASNDGNYKVSIENDGTFTIAPIAGTATVADTSVVYGDALSDDKVTVNGTDTSELSADNFEIVDTKTKSVVTADKLQVNGSYTVQLTQKAQDALSKANPNYTLSFAAGGLTVTKRPITVQVNNVTTTYDGKAHGANGFVVATDVSNNALVDGDSDNALGVTLNPISETDAGTYTITGKADSANYDVTLKDGALNITQADGNVVVTGTSVVYGDSLPSLLVSVHGAAAIEMSADNFEIVDTKTKSIVTADKLQVNGTYTVQLTKVAQNKLSKDNSNYKLSFGTDAALTVTKRPITVQINNVTTTYDGAVHGSNGFIVATDVPNNALVDGDSNGALSVTLNPISETNVGSYTISGKADSANYDVTLKDGALNITQADGNVAVTGTSVVYGDSLPSLSVSVNGAADSELSADNFEIVDTKTNAVVTADKLQVNGSYKVRLTQKAQDTLSDANSNYKLSFGTDAALTVTKRPITVQINNVETTYDGTAHGSNGFSIAKDDKLVDGDNDDALSITLNPISETNVGSYTITGKNDSANYDVTLKDGTLKIDQKAGNVAVTGTSVVYGDSLPSLLVSVNGATANKLSADSFEIVDTKTKSVVTASQLQAGGSYTVQLTQKAQDTLSDANGNYNLSFGTDVLTVTKRPVTVQVSDQQSYAGEANPQNDAKLTSGAFKDGEGVTDLNLTYSEPTNPAVGSYTIDATNGNANYDVKVLSGQLTVLGKEKDAAGTTTITEKDSAGNVVKIDKQWPDGSHTTYTYDPATDKRTVSEQKDGKPVGEQELNPAPAKVTLSDDTNTSTTVTLDPETKQPVFEHDTTQTAGDTTTTKDADGNVVKVVKQWPDGNQTTYTYDPISGNRAVTEQKDGKPVDQQKITSDDAKTTLSSGDDVKTIVDTGKPGSQPTFEHDTTQTTTDDAGNVTATTKDDAGNVIDVTKQWTDGSTTKYTYDPATGKQNVTEQKDGKTVDQKTIIPDAPKATLSTGNGVETIVNAPKPGAEPTFDHETTQTTGDTTTTKDANGNVIKVVKQWPDDSQTTYTYDPASGDRTVTEQKDGKTNAQPIAKDTNKATVSAVDGAKTIVNAGQPGSQPTFEHDTTQTTKDDAGNVTATTKDDAGNVIDVTKQWNDGSTTKYTYDPATKTQTVTEQKDGKTVDNKTITPDDPTATLKSGDGVKTIVDATEPGAEPTFDHETTKTDGDTTTTKDADGNVIKVVKQWPDDSQTTYTYDPTTGNRTVTEQRDGKTVDQKTFGTDPAKETLASGDGVKTIVNAGQPGSQPTFEHDTTQTTTDDAGNVTATTKDDAGNVIDVTKQWTDGSATTYTYDPATKTQTVTEQKDGKTVDQKTITPDAPKATLSTGNGVETIVNAPKPGAEPTFDHETTKTTGDTTTTKDADGNVIKVVKQWPDDSQTTYTYDPTTGNRTVTEQKDGKTVDQKTFGTNPATETLASGDGVKTIVNAGKPGAEPTFEHDTTKTTTDKAGNITTTTKDAGGNVIEVTKQWTDGSKTIYTSDPTTGKQTVTEQKDGKTVDEKTITPNAKATLASGNGAETIVTAGEPGTEPTFEHDATKTTTDKSGNVTTTTKDANGNVIKVTEQWTDGSVTTYTYDPVTGKRVVTEQRDGKVVDQQTIDPDATKATLSSGVGVETIVNAGQPGSQPTFEHETIKTTTDKSGNVTATTTDANGNAVKVAKQWTDGSKTIYTYDPATGKRTVTEQRDGKTVDQQTIDPNASQATLVDGAGGKVIVNFGKAGAEPSFTRQLAAQTGRRQVTVQKAGINQGKRANKQAKPADQGKKNVQSATANEVAGDVAVTGRVRSQQKAKSNQKQTELPQTGQKNENVLAEIGVVLLALLAVPFIRRRSH
ncbi:MBG domain-containing protein [Lactiplantibacillus xiangfangensis]|uniref:MBG domain-containing protein n=1 Tax=Lactiplantibacillus xiangfangensis TaxID=942150 RepID=UPI0007103310|nr:MBG domain-containing protein [Lactiplantibacillus xiangfangensis]